MKPHTKDVLELGTDILVEVGLKRKSRGKAIWEINEEMWGCIQLSPRVFGDGSFHLDILGFVYWDKFEKMMSASEGQKYKFTGFPTVTKFLSPQPLLFFPPDEIVEAELQRLRRQVTDVAISEVEKMADTNYFIEETKLKVDTTWSHLERYIGMIWLTRGYEAAKSLLPEVCKIAEKMDERRVEEVKEWFNNAKAVFES